MLTDSEQSPLLSDERPSFGFRFAAVGSAVLITALLLSGYAYLRNRHSKQSAAKQSSLQDVPAPPKGPPKAHVLVDDAMLQGGKILIGGTVRNISGEALSGLLVELELHRRKDGSPEQKILDIVPSQLLPQEEGRYSVKLNAREYSSVRLAGLKNGEDMVLAYSSSPGQKRPPERLEPRVIMIPRPQSRRDQFLNSPDNPARVP